MPEHPQHTPGPYCPIASLHSSRDLERGGAPCECVHCNRECDCLLAEIKGADHD